jgi:SHS2 domain-containing protein
MEPTFELFDHTADIGIRASAPTMAELVRPASDGLYAVIGDFVTRGTPQPIQWRLDGDDAAELLRDYLAELLVLFEQEHRIVREPVVETFSNERLIVSAQAIPVDEDKSDFRSEVKAITYHELEIAEIPGGFQATIIVDI